MRASIRGSIRSVMVTDSDDSALPATADSIRRRSGRFSAQNPASASSLSKSGTSSQFAKVLTANYFCRASGRKRLFHFPLIKKPFLRLERARVQNTDGTAVRPIHADDSDAAGGHSEIEKSRLHAKARRVGQQPHGK